MPPPRLCWWEPRAAPLELVLNTLYFGTEPPEALGHSETAGVRQDDLAAAIPMYVRFRSRGHPIVGTTFDYFEFRNLRIAAGRQVAMLGECVLGARAAQAARCRARWPGGFFPRKCLRPCGCLSTQDAGRGSAGLLGQSR